MEESGRWVLVRASEHGGNDLYWTGRGWTTLRSKAKEYVKKSHASFIARSEGNFVDVDKDRAEL